MRSAEIKRTTAETKVSVALDLDGTGKGEISTKIGFFDHMMQLFTAHSRYDLRLEVEGDTCVDFHHSVEDAGIALGQALKKALGNKGGIARYADIVLPMDETLMMCAVDLSGRAYLNYDVLTYTEKVGDFDCQLVKEFLLAFVRNAEITLHFKMLAGENSHHILEAVFKALARVLRKATDIDERLQGAIPSSKGAL